MSFRHRIRASLAAALAISALATGCSDSVTGSAAQGVDQQATDWTQRPGMAALGTLPADSSTRQRISYVDITSLNGPAMRATYPPTTTEAGTRPKSETRWVGWLTVSDGCSAVLDNESEPLRTGLPAASLTVRLRGEERTGSAAFCWGGTLLAQRIADPDIRGDDLVEQSVAGVAGTSARGTWIGAEGDRIIVADIAVLGEEWAGAIAGTRLEAGSLLQDRGVRAVLDAAPDAAMVEMGTQLVSQNPDLAPPAVLAAYREAIDEGGFALPPVPSFGGYSWTSTGGLVGTTTFVTSYPSEANAATMTELLNDVWQRLGPSKFDQAVTVQQGTIVITRIPQIGANTFRGDEDSPAEYPAFLGRGN